MYRTLVHNVMYIKIQYDVDYKLKPMLLNSEKESEPCLAPNFLVRKTTIPKKELFAKNNFMLNIF